MTRRVLAFAIIPISVTLGGVLLVNHRAPDAFVHDERSLDYKAAWSFFHDIQSDGPHPDLLIWNPDPPVRHTDLPAYRDTCARHDEWAICSLTFTTRIGNPEEGWVWGEDHRSLAWTETGARCEASALRERGAIEPMIPVVVRAARDPYHVRAGLSRTHRTGEWDGQLAGITPERLASVCAHLIANPDE